MTALDVIRLHEGTRHRPYCDKCGQTITRIDFGWGCGCTRAGKTPGNMTIGIGHNLDAAPIDGEAIETICNDDIEHARQSLLHYDCYLSLSLVRQQAMIDMMFTLGSTRFADFKGMLAALNAKDFHAAALQMRLSKWFDEARQRVEDDATAIETDAWSLR